MRAGRKRKPGVMRDAKGKSRGLPDAIDPQSLAVRVRELRRDGIDADTARAFSRDPFAGFTLGRLRLIGIAAEKSGLIDPRAITHDQCDAGQRFANLCEMHARIMGYAKGSPKSPALSLVSFGVSTADEPDEATIKRVRHQFRASYDALIAAVGPAAARRCHDICQGWVRVDQMGEADFGNLRVALNALGKVLR